MDHRTRTTVRFSVSEEGQNGDSSSSRSIPSGVTPQPDTLTTVNSKLEENSVKSDTTESVQCRVSKVIEALFLTPIVLVLLGFLHATNHLLHQPTIAIHNSKLYVLTPNQPAPLPCAPNLMNLGLPS